MLTRPACACSPEMIESLRKESITFVFARLHDPTSADLDQAGVLDLVGEEHLLPDRTCGCSGRTGPRPVGRFVIHDQRALIAHARRDEWAIFCALGGRELSTDWVLRR